MRNYEKYKSYRSNEYVIDVKFGDVTGDGNIDKVYVTGIVPEDSLPDFYTDLTLHIEPSKGEGVKKLIFDEGYFTTITLNPFTDKSIEFITIVNSTENTGGDLRAEIYSYENNVLDLKFNYVEFITQQDFIVRYLDYYRVVVWNRKLGIYYLIDIGHRSKEYLNIIYDDNGKLKAPREGFVGGIIGFYPIDILNNGIFSIEIIQNIYGISADDSLGFINSVTDYQNGVFYLGKQYVQIEGINTKW